MSDYDDDTASGSWDMLSDPLGIITAGPPPTERTTITRPPEPERKPIPRRIWGLPVQPGGHR
jgi:hypothetical protein